MSRRTLKVIIIGDGSAGKTSLRSRYLHNTYKPAYISTIGADFVSKTIEVDIPVPTYPVKKARQNGSASAAPPNGEIVEASSSSAQQPPKFRSERIRINLSIWDTAGQERFKGLGSAFYRGSDAVIIAFDLIAKGALARTLHWYNDFCRLGNVGHEDEGMNSRQVKMAREQRERFCWVGVGCKGDLLEELSQAGEGEWKGVQWAEARGWFDTMIPRRLPEGEEEQQQGYPYHENSESQGETALPYTLGQEIPARPEDVLSRPNKASASPQISSGANEAGSSLGRPPEAGLPPGTAPTPGKALQKQQQLNSPRKSHQRSEMKARGSGEKRKSIRSIDVWQGDQLDALGTSTDTAASSSTSAPQRKPSGASYRSRYDSATSAGGPPSVYYSVRGSTVQSQSPAGSAASSTSTFGKAERKTNKGLNSQDTRSRKQSNLSESVTNDEDGESHDTETEREISSPRTDGSSSKTVKRKEEKGEEPLNTSDDDSSDPLPFVPTIPSGDPIPFPINDDLEDDDEVDRILRRGSSLRSKSRSVSQSIPRKDAEVGEGQMGRKVNAIAEEAQKLRDEEEEEVEQSNKRATLFSARPSSISSTIKHDDEDEDNIKDDMDGDMDSAGDSYRDQMIEQGFRLFFTSAKEGEGIDAVFEHIAKRVAMRWKLEEWEEQAEAERLGGRGKNGQVRTAPPTDEEIERERIKRAIKISSGKGTGSCCS